MATPRHDWFLNDWLKAKRKKQADVVRELDWNKAKVSLTASGKQPYTRDDVNEIAAYLEIHPWELLMHPADAAELRKLAIAADGVTAIGKRLHLVSDRTGTDG
tara:strand:- start:37451 stop:37759 length:309 start_codon:yes stop_codon:yes gene_type:complete